MSKIQLHSDYPHNHVSVPRVFIDTYMTDANGEFVKVYLYLLRCMGSQQDCDCSISAIADHFNYTEKDILRALKYWEKVKVLSLDTDVKGQITGLCFHDLTGNVQPDPVVSEKTPAPAKTKTASKTRKSSPAASKPEYTLDQCKQFQNNHEIAELLYIIEKYLGHTLTPTEMNTVFYWYDGLKFTGSLIEYLVEYCISNGHSSLRYMDKVALSWEANGIDTIEKAKEQVNMHSKTYYAVMKAFGIAGRNLADSEAAYANKWSKEYAFDLDIIQEACRRTIAATQKASFEYADTILTNWHANNVHTLKDISALDEVFTKSKRTMAAAVPQTAKRNKFNNFQQRQYDSEEYEKMLLTTSIQ